MISGNILMQPAIKEGCDYGSNGSVMDPFRVKGLEVGGKRLSLHLRRTLTDEEFIVLIKPIVKTVAVSQGIDNADECEDEDGRGAMWNVHMGRSAKSSEAFQC